MDDRSVDPPMSGTRRLLFGELTGEVIGAFFEVYNAFAHGLLESAYAGAMEVELDERGVRYQREVELAVWYKGRVVGVYRPDFFVDGRLIVELKAASSIGHPERRQLLHYLRVTNTRLGLLLHFGPQAKFYRVINEL